MSVVGEALLILVPVWAVMAAFLFVVFCLLGAVCDDEEARDDD